MKAKIKEYYEKAQKSAVHSLIITDLKRLL